MVDLGCGTGANFPWLERAVTASGRIVGVDLTDAMLREARGRVESAGWVNVELVESDVANYELPGNIGGVLSTYAMTMVDDYDGVIRRAAEALRTGGRLAILEMKRPEGLPGVDGSFRSLAPPVLWSEPCLCRANALGVSQAAPVRGVLRRCHLPLCRGAAFVTAAFETTCCIVGGGPTGMMYGNRLFPCPNCLRSPSGHEPNGVLRRGLPLPHLAAQTLP